MKKFTLCLSLLTALLAAWALFASASADNGWSDLSFEYEKLRGFASNQFAVWVGDKDNPIPRKLDGTVDTKEAELRGEAKNQVKHLNNEGKRATATR